MEPLTRQQVFDKVWTGLKAQGFVRAHDSLRDICQYRGPEGRKCAAGQLFTDEQMSAMVREAQQRGFTKSDVNGAGVYSLEAYYAPVTFPAELRQQIGFIARCQREHDGHADPVAMEAAFRGIATQYGLTIPGEDPQPVVAPTPTIPDQLIS